jgi:hypothetical protein
VRLRDEALELPKRVYRCARSDADSTPWLGYPLGARPTRPVPSEACTT